MVRLRLALLYGLGVWVGLVLASLALLPLEDASEPLHESLKSSALVAITLAFTIRYLGRAAGPATAAGGLAAGLLWSAVAVLLDLALYLLGAFTIGLGAYFADVASSYLVIPITTVLVTTYLAPRAALQ